MGITFVIRMRTAMRRCVDIKTRLFYMRSLLLIISAILFLQLSAYSQPASYTNWGAFNQRIEVKQYRGKKFQLQAAVKSKPIDSSAACSIWARVDRPNKKIGFFYNMMDKPIQLNEWKIYTISGKIDKDAEWLAFGGLYHDKGQFYFDDFKLLIETDKNKLEAIPVSQGDFEGDTAAIRASWGFLQKRNGFWAAQTNETAFEGKHSFLVDGSNFTPANSYGSNSEVGHYASVNNIRLYYEVYGEGEPLLLLHGNSESIASFRAQIPELSKQYKVIALDTRGQGKSTEDGKKFTYELFAEDAKALLDHLQLDSVHVLGWSDGGNIGLIMAIKYPSKVKSLSTMGANLYNNTTSVKPWVNNMLLKERKELIDTIPGDIFRIRMINLLLNEPNIKPEWLTNISCPVLVMAGSDDVIKEAHTKLIAANIKRSQLVIFPKGNHFEPSERPARFNKTVLDFLNGLKKP